MNLTPENVKKVWDDTPHPSFVKVAKKLRDSGFPIAPMTIFRMQKNNWVSPPRSTDKRGRPRKGDGPKFAARDLARHVAAASEKTTFREVCIENGASENLIDFLEGIPIDTTDEIRRLCNKFYCRLFVTACAKLEKSGMVLDQPNNFAAMFVALTAGAETVNKVGFGVAAPESLNTIQGTVTDRTDPRSQQLRSLLRGGQG